MHDQTLDISAGAHGFGDGNHPTTMGVLTALEAIDASLFAPRIACDMGAGSGILALAVTTKFGCPVLAVDLERRAVETLRANAAANGLAERIIPVHSDGFRHPEITRHAPFGLITMNILAEPLLALARDAAGMLEEGGVLLISGILQWQEESLRRAYEGLGLELASRLVIGDWVTLCFQRP